MAYTTINKPNLHFNTVTYTGNGTTNAVTGVGFQPNFTWLKCRSFANRHILLNVIQGTYSLSSNETSAEVNRATDGFTSLDSDGFTLNGSGGGGGDINISSRTYASWNWKANGAGVSNTQGNLTSTVSANTTSGFSIVNYTTNSTANRTIGHGLGVAPAMIIIKNRNAVSDWAVYHKSLGNTNWIRLNTDGITYADSGYWNNTSPTSTVFTIGATNTNVNDTSGNSYIAYCFAEVKGFSKFGSYTGNGSTDGTFVYTGFKPTMVIAKASSTTGQWSICDNRRGTANTANGEFLFAESSEALNAATNNWDFLSNGFKARANYAAHNTSGVTYIYAAFAEQPLVGTNNVPATAR